ncbi:programmed cell death protein 2-like [Synchiropus splendidus]|uniref:programmed cell death protein 2-like n=1 Tax=Synchiropus splendidus TaxID=270530 RepID=UPI00237DCA95|nr:programmed cell death protein 2-like [Synchiropus splendidus]
MAADSEERVLIGVCDVELDRRRHHSSFLTNKVGGPPDWCPGFVPEVPLCGRCGASLAHVVQIYCPLAASPYNRTLNVFACLGSECSGLSESWRVLRSQSLEVKAAPQTPEPVPAQSATDWCESADDWGMEDDEWGGAAKESPKRERQEAEEGSSAMAKGGPAEISNSLQDLHLSEVSASAPEFRSFFISVMEESDLDGDDEELDHAQQLLKEYETREGVMVGDLVEEDGGSCAEESYEKMSTRHGDIAFSRFMKRISLCPQQILRYCRGSEPLYIAPPPPGLPQLLPCCSSCGGARTFELQLMPTLVSLLKRSDRNSTEAALEFGTVLVYTCKSSCWTSGSTKTVEEFCLVQADPDQQLFK